MSERSGCRLCNAPTRGFWALVGTCRPCARERLYEAGATTPERCFACETPITRETAITSGRCRDCRKRVGLEADA